MNALFIKFVPLPPAPGLEVIMPWVRVPGLPAEQADPVLTETVARLAQDIGHAGETVLLYDVRGSLQVPLSMLTLSLALRSIYESPDQATILSNIDIDR